MDDLKESKEDGHGTEKLAARLNERVAGENALLPRAHPLLVSLPVKIFTVNHQPEVLPWRSKRGEHWLPLHPVGSGHSDVTGKGASTIARLVPSTLMVCPFADMAR